MADTKISALSAATTPLAGTEVLPIVQSGVTKKVAVSDLTAGRAVSAASLTLTSTPLGVASGGTGITSFGTGVATWLSTPSSANLAAAVTDETGTGSLVFASSPTLTTPTVATIKSAASLTPTTFQDSAAIEIGKLCRAWVYFDGTTAPPTVKQSFNVTSVSKSGGTGTYDITITNALPNSQPTVVTGFRRTSAFNEILDVVQSSNTSTNVRVRNADILGTGADSVAVFVAVFA